MGSHGTPTHTIVLSLRHQIDLAGPILSQPLAANTLRNSHFLYSPPFFPSNSLFYFLRLRQPAGGNSTYHKIVKVIHAALPSPANSLPPDLSLTTHL